MKNKLFKDCFINIIIIISPTAFNEILVYIQIALRNWDWSVNTQNNCNLYKTSEPWIKDFAHLWGKRKSCKDVYTHDLCVNIYLNVKKKKLLPLWKFCLLKSSKLRMSMTESCRFRVMQCHQRSSTLCLTQWFLQFLWIFWWCYAL